MNTVDKEDPKLESGDSPQPLLPRLRGEVLSFPERIQRSAALMLVQRMSTAATTARISIHLSAVEIEEYLLGRLDAEPSRLLEEHVHTCPHCQHLLEREFDYIDLMQEALLGLLIDEADALSRDHLPESNPAE